ncbi:MAG: glucosaminidase domain-containing protein, partial [Alphaproteobacteria bacterium]
HAIPPAEPAPTVGVIANNGGAAELSSLQLANIPPLAKVDGNLPSGARPVLAQEKAAVTRTYVNAFRHVYANNIMPVSFEMPAEMTPNSFAQAVFNVKLGGIRFLPAPNKPRLFDNSVASATIQLPLPKPSARPPQTGQMGSVAALDAHFERIDYDLANVRNSGNNVPRLYLDKLPADIADVPSVATRKRIFIKSVLPVVLRVNEDILAARQRLQQLRTTLDGGMSLTDEQRDWLYQMAERYETDPYDWDAFMARVDIVPPSLAIAQAAEESGWGTSRFAREGNALFGQYTYKASNGILPEERANGRHHLIRAYSSLVEGVRSYMHNLNYHRAYGEFRSARKWLRAHAKPMDGHTLAGELIRYSERGAAYVETIRHIIRANKLSPLDDARLHEDRWTQHDPAMPGRHS